MTQLLGAVAGGIGIGSIYALLALGFVIIYKSMGVISFAQPAFLLAGTVLVTYLSPEIGFVAGAAGSLTILVAALAGGSVSAGSETTGLGVGGSAAAGGSAFATMGAGGGVVGRLSRNTVTPTESPTSASAPAPTR